MSVSRSSAVALWAALAFCVLVSPNAHAIGIREVQLSPLEEAILNRAVHCPNAVNPDREALAQLLVLERKHGVPDKLRGMSLAAACVESHYDPKAKGDYRLRDGKMKPMAIGLFQQWPWWVPSYHIDRQDPIQATDAWLTHIANQVKGVQRKCGHVGEERTWVIAWVVGVRAPRKDGRCHQEPTHWSVLKDWRRSWSSELSV